MSFLVRAVRFCGLWFLLWSKSFPSADSFSAPVLMDHAPSWQQLQEELVTNTPTGRRLAMESQQQTLGYGPPSAKARLRLFEEEPSTTSPKVTLYRDDSAWCPYCQKVWLFLEFRKIPYRVETLPLNAYGDKPAWFTRMVDGGKLPAIELDGKVYTESMEIVKLLDATFPPTASSATASDSNDKQQQDELLELEKELQSAWFSLVFYPVQGEALETAREKLLETLGQVNDALGAHTDGPWFLGGDSPSIVDIHFIPSMERLIASALYWKALKIRGKFENLDCWLQAFEACPEYLATKSDYYTLIMSIPSQNGPGYAIPDAKNIANAICGLEGAWELPLKDNELMVLSVPGYLDSQKADEEARHTAAYQLIANHKGIVQFAARGAGEAGRPSYHAELADPYAEPNEDFATPVDVCLRHVTASLIGGVDSARDNALQDMAGKRGDGELKPNWDAYEDEDGRTYWWNEETGDTTWTPPTRQLDTCLAYLRDRIGVPRDMPESAAMQLRAHLNWAIELLDW